MAGSTLFLRVLMWCFEEMIGILVSRLSNTDQFDRCGLHQPVWRCLTSANLWRCHTSASLWRWHTSPSLWRCHNHPVCGGATHQPVYAGATHQPVCWRCHTSASLWRCHTEPEMDKGQFFTFFLGQRYQFSSALQYQNSLF